MRLCEDLGAGTSLCHLVWDKLRENQGTKNGVAFVRWIESSIIDDILDLLEYCNGSTVMYCGGGRRRAANGHPPPYHLKFIEIGNENGWQTVKEYVPRYAMIHDAILAHYPDLKIMFNAGIPSPASPELSRFCRRPLL